MYIPLQNVLVAGLAATGLAPLKSKTVSKGEVMDYAVETCIDEDGNQRCTAPFLVSADSCYNIEWTTDGKLSHTTVEVR